MVQRIEEFRQVKVHTSHIPLIYDLKCLVDRGLATPVWTKALTVRAEYGFVFLTESLSNRLLDDSIDSGWNFQRPELAFLLLLDHDLAYGLRFVFPRLHGFHYLDGVRTKVVSQHVQIMPLTPSPLCSP